MFNRITKRHHTEDNGLVGSKMKQGSKSSATTRPVLASRHSSWHGPKPGSRQGAGLLLWQRHRGQRKKDSRVPGSSLCAATAWLFGACRASKGPSRRSYSAGYSLVSLRQHRSRNKLASSSPPVKPSFTALPRPMSQVFSYPALQAAAPHHQSRLPAGTTSPATSRGLTTHTNGLDLRLSAACMSHSGQILCADHSVGRLTGHGSAMESPSSSSEQIHMLSL